MIWLLGIFVFLGTVVLFSLLTGGSIISFIVSFVVVSVAATLWFLRLSIKGARERRRYRQSLTNTRGAA